MQELHHARHSSVLFLSLFSHAPSSQHLFSACTFLGPSRKRGPPKGYIDAIEARLHQTEALLGIMIGSNDQRARTLLEDLAKVNSFFQKSADAIFVIQSHRTLSPKR